MDKKLEVKIIALDLDDTLLNSQTEISDENVQALQECVRRGIYVVLCSGRAEEGILPFVRKLDIAGSPYGKYLIAINGCSVFDLHLRQQILKCNVDPQILKRADELAAQNGLDTEIYRPDCIFYRNETKWTRLDPDLCHINGKCAEDYDGMLSEGSPKMLIPGEPEKVEVLQKILKEEFAESAVIFTSKPFFLEVLPPGCGKGEAIEFLCKHLGISMKNAMCFGDSMNDESMIRMCGESVAMCNGLEYIKKAAAHVSEFDNNNSGVGRFIKKYVL